ncbi:hypothetical protein N866_08750 [Actinotalea ferrariae CF5-4]|uniref:Uncharacterized protein n=1 Tax=Actinotalea ferrariae CF5-4 TaxID=948458 RepID=A0A021VTW3_9CELL|nr:hypothetical protein [Actinotalea ferrariae]EYR64568.1 hypothetical protein N866_08750 [Actinotalea ferrariae CF5-4]
MAGETARAVPPSSAPPAAPVAPEPDDGPEDDRRTARVVVGVLLALGAIGVWELGAVHDDGPLLGGETTGGSVCLAHTTPGSTDFTVGGPVTEPSRDVVVTDVRAVRASNLVVREGVALPFGEDRSAIGAAEGYPPRALPDAWAGSSPLVGAVLPGGAPSHLVWHVEVVDPTREASYEAVEIEYRSGHRRYLAVLGTDVVVQGGAGTCPPA